MIGGRIGALRAFLPILGRFRRRRPRGKILAIKWGLNPNSSSLGVDVTFLLFGAAAIGMLTPMVGALLRWKRTRKEGGDARPPLEPETSR